jgi:hypothetical protein
VPESSFVWLPPFLFLFPVFHFYPTRNGEQTVTTLKAPCVWKKYIRRGATQCPEGIVNDTAVTTSVPRSPRHGASHFGFGGLDLRSPSKDVTPSATRKPRVGFWRGSYLSSSSYIRL